jgi:anthranilate synthase/aminodeoxychorismate synthase-like glutamine amidotransferase
MRLAMIDNYDSFTYNLVQYLAELGAEPEVFRNDAVTVDELANFDGVVISPGPGTPDDAGVSNEAIKALSGKIAILGVCLGHQCIGAAYGAGIVRAGRPIHGKVAQIAHDGRGLFAGLPNPFLAARYHSLVIARDALPATLRVTATAEDGEIMAVEHASHPVIGVQFHPESVLTEHGHALLRNFLALARTGAPPVPAAGLQREPTRARAQAE